MPASGTLQSAAALTRVRFRVVAFAVALAAVTYLDRVCISIVAPQIMEDLGLSRMQMSYVFSSFTIAYAVFEIPTAWWADRVGSRKVLTRIVLWWSAFTLATAAAFNYVSMLAVRFLFGVGEAGAWPNAARVFSRWIPSHERGRVQGIFFAGAHLSGGVTPIIVAWLATFLHWRAIFVLFGFVGVGWAAAWYRWFRDEPREHQSVGEAERDLIESTRGLPPAHGGSWARVFRTPRIVPLCLQYVANTYGFYFFITWLPSYLATARHLEKAELALFSGLPLLLSVFADLTGGVGMDWLSKRFGNRAGRCGIGFAGYLIAAVAMTAGALVPDGRLSGLLIALGGASSMFTLAPAWATAIGLGGRNAGVLSATMNTAGQVGGIMSPIVLALLVDNFGDWSLPLLVLAALYFIAAICWLFIRPETSQAQSATG